MTRIGELLESGFKLEEISEVLSNEISNTVSFSVKKKLKKEFPNLEFNLPLVISKNNMIKDFDSVDEGVSIKLRATPVGDIYLILFYNNVLHQWVSEDQGKTWETLDNNLTRNNKVITPLGIIQL